MSTTQFLWMDLFRGADHARAAIQDLMHVGLPPDGIHVIGGSGNAETTAAGIRTLGGIAERDERSLAACIEQGGIVVVVSPHAVFRQEVETIFLRYQAAQDCEMATDEYERATSFPPLRWRPTFDGA